MKFVRREDLSTESRIEIALKAIFCKGQYGKMTEIAREYAISRTFLYQLAAMATLQLGILFSTPGAAITLAGGICVSKLILLLRLEGNCSLSAIHEILQVMGYAPNSTGYISEFLKKIGNYLPSTLLANRPKWVFYMSDEIFSLAMPILVTIDADSTAILKIELASNRSSEQWKAHFEALQGHNFVVLGMASDRGQGLVQGFQKAHEKALWVCDYFHEFQDLYRLKFRLEQKAYAAINAEYEAERKFNNAKSEENLQKRFDQYQKAQAQCEETMDLFDEVDSLLKELQKTLQLAGIDGLKSKAQVEQDVKELLDLFEVLDYVPLNEIVTTLRSHLEEILVPFEQLDRVYHELLENIDQVSLEYLVLAWHHQNLAYSSKGKYKRYHLEESQFWLDIAEGDLSKRFEATKDLVFESMDSIIRSSSLVEMVNSILRPYLERAKGQITQEFLNLIMFYHNHRRYKSGRRKGKAPIELLTGEKLQAHWLDLLMQHLKNSEEQESLEYSSAADSYQSKQEAA